MPSARVLRGVASNTLGTYLSRYSRFDGYWLFGFLVPELDELDVDLLGHDASSASPSAQAVSRAQHAFQEQLGKAGYPRAGITRAILTLRRGDATRVAYESRTGEGWRVVATIQITATNGRTFGGRQEVAVATHDPLRETRSAGPDLRLPTDPGP